MTATWMFVVLMGDLAGLVVFAQPDISRVLFVVSAISCAVQLRFGSRR